MLKNMKAKIAIKQGETGTSWDRKWSNFKLIKWET